MDNYQDHNYSSVLSDQLIKHCCSRRYWLRASININSYCPVKRICSNSFIKERLNDPSLPTPDNPVIRTALFVERISSRIGLIASSILSFARFPTVK